METATSCKFELIQTARFSPPRSKRPSGRLAVRPPLTRPNQTKPKMKTQQSKSGLLGKRVWDHEENAYGIVTQIFGRLCLVAYDDGDEGTAEVDECEEVLE